ncbi:MAG: secretin N-terminal domain-containing protein, partial [candidate division NC10 bacterium]
MVSWMRIGFALLGLAVLTLFPSDPALAQGACRDRLPAEPITLNLRDANVQTTLRLLSQQYRVNMVVTDEVKGTVTLDFFQVPARDVFQVIIESANLQCVEATGVLRVSTTTRLKQEADERQKAQDDRTRLDADTRQKIVEARQKEEEFEQIRARGPVKEMTIRLSYADAEEVARTISGILGLPSGGELVPTLQPQLYAPPPPVTIPPQGLQPPTVQAPAPLPPAEALSKGLTVRAYKPTNTVFIRFYENDLNRIVKLIKESLDIPLAQVQIAAQMVITTQSALEQIGIAWGGAAIGQPRYPRDPALIGQGYSQAGVTQGGTSQVPSAPAGGTPVVGTYSQNPGFLGPANTLLPISAATGFPVGGNLINLPITAANPALGLLFGIVGSDFNLNLAIQALETQGKARSLSEPRI